MTHIEVGHQIHYKTRNSEMTTNQIQNAYTKIDNVPTRPFSTEEVRNLLRNYHESRDAVMIISQNLQSEADKLLYPSIPIPDKDRVSKSLDTGSIAEGMIARSEKAGRYYQDTVRELIEITKTLDKLLWCVTKSKPKYRIVLLKTYFDKKDDWAIGEELELEEGTVRNMRSDAIALLTEHMNR